MLSSKTIVGLGLRTQEILAHSSKSILTDLNN